MIAQISPAVAVEAGVGDIWVVTRSEHILVGTPGVRSARNGGELAGFIIDRWEVASCSMPSSADRTVIRPCHRRLPSESERGTPDWWMITSSVLV